MFNKIILLVICTLPSYGLDGEIELSQHNQQINYFLETIPDHVREPLNNVIKKIHSMSTDYAYQKFVGWVVRWGPYVDFESWPSIIDTFNSIEPEEKTYFYDRSHFFQALCSRAKQSDRDELCQMLNQIPLLKINTATFGFLPIAPNSIIAKWLPRLKITQTLFNALRIVAEEPLENPITSFIQAKIRDTDAWGLCMTREWGTKNKLPTIRLTDGKKHQACNCALSEEPKTIRHSPAKGP